MYKHNFWYLDENCWYSTSGVRGEIRFFGPKSGPKICIMNAVILRWRNWSSFSGKDLNRCPRYTKRIFPTNFFENRETKPRGLALAAYVKSRSSGKNWWGCSNSKFRATYYLRRPWAIQISYLKFHDSLWTQKLRSKLRSLSNQLKIWYVDP